MAELRLQNFVIARLADYCDFRSALTPPKAPDPISYLWTKLGEIDAPLHELKRQLLRDAIAAHFSRLDGGTADAPADADFRQLLEAYLSRGDFVDAVFALDPGTLKDAGRRKAARALLEGFSAKSLLTPDGGPSPSPAGEKLIAEIYRRLGFDLVEKVLAHKPLDARRLRFILRRCRANSSDYCAVFRFPTGDNDAFTPFILPRVEALVAANRRVLARIRTGA